MGGKWIFFLLESSREKDSRLLAITLFSMDTFLRSIIGFSWGCSDISDSFEVIVCKDGLLLDSFVPGGCLLSLLLYFLTDDSSEGLEED